MTLGLPGELREETGNDLFKRNDVRETEAEGITQPNFNTDDFLVSSGVVNLKNKTSYARVGAPSFQPLNPDSDDHSISAGEFTANTDNLVPHATIQLPHGAVITGAIVYGSAGLVWRLLRINAVGNETEMAGGAINVQDTTITDATVDNANNAYVFEVIDLDTGEKIYNARIRYTTDYD